MNADIQARETFSTHVQVKKLTSWVLIGVCFVIKLGLYFLLRFTWQLISSSYISLLKSLFFFSCSKTFDYKRAPVLSGRYHAKMKAKIVRYDKLCQ